MLSICYIYAYTYFTYHLLHFQSPKTSYVIPFVGIQTHLYFQGRNLKRNLPIHMARGKIQDQTRVTLRLSPTTGRTKRASKNQGERSR